MISFLMSAMEVGKMLTLSVLDFNTIFLAKVSVPMLIVMFKKLNFNAKTSIFKNNATLEPIS